MPRKWRIIGRHKWITNTTITESVCRDDEHYRRFTATIYGYRNWRLWQGNMSEEGMSHVVATVQAKVQGIKARIAADDETVFTDQELQAW